MKTETSVKRMPGEIELDASTALDSSNCRTSLLRYYLENGDTVAHGEFKGEVQAGDPNRGILFKRLYIGFFENLMDWVDGKEDHVWLLDTDAFKHLKLKTGDCVQFSALAYPYQRKNGSVDFGLKAPEQVKKIPQYELPSDEQLAQQEADRLACELCLMADQCDRIVCIMGR